MVSGGVLIGALGAAKLVTGSVTVPMLVIGGCLGVAGLLPFAGSAAAFMAGGVAIAVANTTLMTHFQSSVAAEIQGRVFGAFVVVGAGVVLATLLWGLPLCTVPVVEVEVPAAGLGV